MKKSIIALCLILILTIAFTSVVFAYEACPDCGGRVYVASWFCRSAAGADTRSHYCGSCDYSWTEYRDCIHMR